jgi:hypothetical protein
LKFKETAVTGFDERERAEEARFVHDEKLRFKAKARRDKLLGLWAAGLIGKTGEVAASYAAEVLRSDVDAPGDEAVFLKVRGDLEKAGLMLTDHQIHRQMKELMETAIMQVKAE